MAETPLSPRSAVSVEETSWEKFSLVHDAVFQGKESDARAARVTYRFCAALELDESNVLRAVVLCMRMLLACNYDKADLDILFATALVNLRTPWVLKLTARMGQQERMLVTLLHIYCAHSMVFDEFVPLSVWHEWLFQSFCSRKTMNVALKKVCMLSNWRFMVRLEALEPALAELRGEEATVEADEHAPTK